MEVAPLYSYVLRRTTDLAGSEVVAYCRLFEKVFGKRMTEQEFGEKFCRSSLGHSIHALMMHAQDGLVGAYSVRPERYRHFGEERLFALSVDTMIEPEHRTDPLHFKRLAELAFQELSSLEIPFVFGFPNDNSRKYFEKVLGWREIQELPFYAFPARPGCMAPWASPIDRMWRLTWAAVFSSMANLARSRELPRPIARVRAADLQQEPGVPGRSRLSLGKQSDFTYSIHDEPNGLEVAYITDLNPLSKKSLLQALSILLRLERKLDLVAYVGTLPFGTPLPLLRVPASRIPKRIRMLGRILRPDNVDPRVFDHRNWIVNLSSFDVR